MPVPAEFKQRLATRLELVSGFLKEAEDFLKPLNLSSDAFFQIKLAIEEAITNAMRHGNKLDPSLYVDVKVMFDNGRLTVEVKDQGEGFALDSLADPTSHGNRDKPSGRGVFLMNNMMDSVEFLEGGSLVKMVKNFKTG